MEKMKWIKKGISALLALNMVLSSVPLPVFAVTEDNLCEHHPVHTAECHYAEAVAGSPCTHKHSEDCYAILACLHTCGDECASGCAHECTVDNGCITMELDCHHTHGDCGWSEGTAEVPCGHVHDEACGYVEAVAEILCACTEVGEDGNLIHTEGCGYVAPVEGVACGHTEHTDCGYAPATEGTPCTHTHAVKVDSADSCYKLLCSHKDGGHDDACGYAQAVEAHECHYECAECVAALTADETTAPSTEATTEPSTEATEPAPVCDCGTDDAAIHATTCAMYVAPETAICTCAEKCTDVNIWCDVCGFDYTACAGTDTSAVYVDAECTHSFGTDGTCTVCGTSAVAKIGDTYYTTLAQAAEAVTAENNTIEVLTDVTVGADETLAFAAFATLNVAEGKTVTCNGAVTIGGEPGIIFENALYYYGGDLKEDAGAFALSSVSRNTCWTAGEGHITYMPESNTLTLKQVSANFSTLSASLRAFEYYSDTGEPTLTINFHGSNTITSELKNVFYTEVPVIMNGMGEDAVLNIMGGESNTSAVGARFASLTVNSGTVTIRSGNGEGSCSGASVVGTITVAPGAVLNAACGESSLDFYCGLGAQAIEAEGTINGLAAVLDESGAPYCQVYGNTVLEYDLTTVIVEAQTAYPFFVPTGTTLTVNAGVTLDLSGLTLDDIDFSGTVVNNGTIKLPEGFAITDAPESGSVMIGDKSYTWDSENNKWICPEGGHTGGTATCSGGAICDICGASYGEVDADAHSFGTDGICTLCGAVGYDLYVMGVRVNSANCADVLDDGTVSYDPQTQTLTLTNANIGAADLSGAVPALKVSGGHITLVLVGENKLTGTKNDPGILIESGASVTVSQDSAGSLEVQGLSMGYLSQEKIYVNSSIAGEGDFTVSGGTVSGGIHMGGNITVTGGTVNANFLAAENVIISGGTVTAAGYANVSYWDENAPTGTYGIYAEKDIRISGGTVTTNGGYANIADSFDEMAIYQASATAAMYAGNTVTVTAGTVTAIGGQWNGYEPNSIGNMVLGSFTEEEVAPPSFGEEDSGSTSSLIDRYGKALKASDFSISDQAVFVCGDGTPEHHSHDYAAATCIGGKYCVFCGYTDSALDSENHASTTYTNGFRDCCGVYEPAVLNADGYYEIGNAGQLFWFAQKVNGGENTINAVLTANIDMKTLPWEAMGQQDAPYTGTFDGRGYTISNLSRDTGLDEGTRASFVYYLGEGGCIKNVTFDNADVFTQGHANANASAVVALRNSGTIECVVVSNSRVQLGNYAYLAGIAGVNESSGVIKNCAVLDTALIRRFSGSSLASGGIVYNNLGTVENCYTYNCSYGTANESNGGIVVEGNAPVNSYYYTTSTVAAADYARTAEAFASGEVAYLLNGSADNGIFKQTIGTDATPNFTGAAVYYGYISCADDAQPVYSNNSGASEEKPDHAGALTYENNTADGTHTGTYSCCGSTITEEHTEGTAATCVSGPICSVCKYEYGEASASAHAFADDNVSCKYCGQTIVAKVDRDGALSCYTDIMDVAAGEEGSTTVLTVLADITLTESVNLGYMTLERAGDVTITVPEAYYLTVTSKWNEDNAVSWMGSMGYSVTTRQNRRYVSYKALPEDLSVTYVLLHDATVDDLKIRDGSYNGYLIVTEGVTLTVTGTMAVESTGGQTQINGTLILGENAAMTTADKITVTGTLVLGENATIVNSSTICLNNAELYTTVHHIPAGISGGTVEVNGVTYTYVSEGSTEETDFAPYWTCYGEHTGDLTEATCVSRVNCDNCGDPFGSLGVHSCNIETGYCVHCGEYVAVATVTDGTNTLYAQGGTQLEEAIGIFLEVETIRTLTVALPDDAMLDNVGKGVKTAILREQQSLHLTIQGVTTIPADSELVELVQLASLSLPDVTHIAEGALKGTKLRKLELTAEDEINIENNFMDSGRIGEVDLVVHCSREEEVTDGVTWKGFTFKSVTLPHSYGTYTTANDRHSRTCSICGNVETENCSGGKATCIQKAVCSVCHSEYGEVDLTNHDRGIAYVDGFCENGCYEPATDSNGDGVYEIGNAGQLYWFAQQVNNGNSAINAILTANIVVNAGKISAESTDPRVWTPIGTRNEPYKGTFDGRNFTISGLYVNDSTIENVGLFGVVGTGKVQNVGIINSYLCSLDYVGGVVAINSGTVINCYNTGSVSGRSFIGGAVGYNNGTVTNCYNTGAISGTSYRGGVVGYNPGTVTNCYYLNTAFSGGIYGSDVTGSAEAKTSAQFTSGEVAYLLQGDQAEQVWGQILGTENDDAFPTLGSPKVYYGYTTCDEAQTSAIYTNDSSVSAEKPAHTNSVNGFNECCGTYQAAVLNESGIYEIANAGQLYWFAQQVNGGNATINAILIADITVNEGTMTEDSTDARGWTPIGNSFSKYYAGIFDGNGKTVSGLYLNNSEAVYVGLFGCVKNATVKNVGVINSYLYGDEYVGGVVGANRSGSTVTGCYNTGAVSGSSYVGGVVGLNMDSGSTVTNCYNTGAVSGSSYVGGVVGSNRTGTAMTNCYNTGAVSGSDEVGGVAGRNPSGGTVTNCYYDKTVYTGNAIGSGSGTTTDVTGKTTEEFASGEVAYLLNGSTSEGALVWKQTIGTDASPNFTGGTVYPMTGCDGTSVVGYSNTEGLTDVHSYGKPVFNWKEDNTCTATVTCSIDSSHAETFGCTVTTDTSDASKTVYTASVAINGITYTDTKEVANEVISVDISWGAMEFTYTDGEWQPESHTYADGSWTADNDSNWITVKNNGTVAANVTFAYEKATGMEAINGEFTVDGTNKITEVALAIGKEEKIYLLLTGKPNETNGYVTLGTITVTITTGGE